MVATLKERFAAMRSQSLPIGEVMRMVQNDNAWVVNFSEVREALQQLERENVVRFTRTHQVIAV